MVVYRLTATAQRDIIDILAYTDTHFGPMLRERYAAAIGQALRDICTDPGRRGVVSLDVGPGRLMSFHLRHLGRVGAPVTAVLRNPRHLLVFKFDGPDCLVVVRVLHESMDPRRHVDIDN